MNKSEIFSINIDSGSLPWHILGVWLIPLALSFTAFDWLVKCTIIGAVYQSVWFLLNFAARWLYHR